MNERQVGGLQALIKKFEEHDKCLRDHLQSMEKGPPIEELKTLVNLLDRWVNLYNELQKVIRYWSPIYAEVSRFQSKGVEYGASKVTAVHETWRQYCRSSLREFIVVAKQARDERVVPLQSVNRMTGQRDDRTQWIAQLISRMEKGDKEIEQHLAEANIRELLNAVSALHYDGLEDANATICIEMRNIADYLLGLLQRV
jgi:hypothetical protein